MSDPTPGTATETELIWVKSGRKDGRTALWERHPAHPHKEDEEEGEIFVPNDTPEGKNQPLQVARTNRVGMAIVSGDLVEVDGPKGSATATTSTTAAPTASTTTARTTSST